MSIIWRSSALAHRHAEIGGELEDWNGMGTAWFYDHTPAVSYTHLTLPTNREV